MLASGYEPEAFKKVLIHENYYDIALQKNKPLVNAMLSQPRKSSGVLPPKAGFTLLELLVVISIISFLSTIVSVSLSSAKSKSRDAERLSALQTIHTALLAYELNHDKYPLTSVSGTDLVISSVPFPPFYRIVSASNLIASTPAFGFYSWSDFSASLSGYLNNLRADPLNQGGYFYYYKIFVDASGNPARLSFSDGGPGNACVFSTSPPPGSRTIRGYIGVRLENAGSNNTCLSEFGNNGWRYIFLE